MNADNIRAEIALLKRAIQDERDTGLRPAYQHRIAHLERELAKKKEKDGSH